MSARSRTNQQDLDQLSSTFRLLADKTRLQILLLLADGERNVTSLCEQLDLPQPTVSHHLGLLRLRNIIANRRKGKQVFYAIDPRVDMDDASSLRIGLDRFQVQIAKSGVSLRAAKISRHAPADPASAEY